MADSKHFKSIEVVLDRFGYAYSYTNTKGAYIYTRDGMRDVAVRPNPNDHTARTIIKELERANGAWEATPKRNATAVKERQKQARKALKEQAERLARDRADIVAERDRRLGGLGAVLTSNELQDLARRLEEIDRERHAIEKLMAAPVAGDHAGSRHARHQSGQHEGAAS